MGMGASTKRYRQLQRLYERQKHRCHWCGVEMLPPGSHENRRGVRPHPRLCTYDHLDSHLSAERGQHKGEYRNIAACWQCNHDRAKAEQAALPIEALRERAKRHPQARHR